MSDALDLTLVRNFVIALLIGALVGVEREKRKSAADQASFAGLRTFILFAEAGAVSAWMSLQLETVWLFAAVVLSITAIVTAGYVFESKATPNSFGLTTELAAICVTLLGGAVMFGHEEIAVGLAVVTASVLAFKQPLHGLVEKLGTDDIYAGLRLLIATFIVLPLLPRQTVDPWDALNPYSLWLLVILISSLSLVGYVAVRWLGTERGTLVMGLAGGLVSSTAVTLTFARESKVGRNHRSADALTAGILIAWTVMFARVIVEVAVVYAPLVRTLAIPLGAVGLVAALLAGGFYWRGSAAKGKKSAASSHVPLKNPFSLLAAARFGLLFAVVLLAVKLAQTHLPKGGLYAIAALAGLTDVDAITLSMARMASEGGDTATAAGAIVVAALSNTLVKCAFVVGLGERAVGYRIAGATAALTVVALGALALT